LQLYRLEAPGFARVVSVLTRHTRRVAASPGRRFESPAVGAPSRSAPCLKEKPRLPKKTGPELEQRETLEVSGLTISPNPARCIWFRALPDLCLGIVSGRLGS